MARVSMVVGHGGQTTAMRAMSYELPLLVLPMHPTPDQAMVGRAIADIGPDESYLERRRRLISPLLSPN